PLHDALPICPAAAGSAPPSDRQVASIGSGAACAEPLAPTAATTAARTAAHTEYLERFMAVPSVWLSPPAARPRGQGHLGPRAPRVPGGNSTFQVDRPLGSPGPALPPRPLRRLRSRAPGSAVP